MQQRHLRKGPRKGKGKGKKGPNSFRGKGKGLAVHADHPEPWDSYPYNSTFQKGKGKGKHDGKSSYPPYGKPGKNYPSFGNQGKEYLFPKAKAGQRTRHLCQMTKSTYRYRTRGYGRKVYWRQVGGHNFVNINNQH